jgi:hypothetical protein
VPQDLRHLRSLLNHADRSLAIEAAGAVLTRTQ